ncbi:MAG TPA: hypothetical protein VFS64_09990 [Solirubrobacterales bacterium]|nr:hypothetical protein [Solirubrobacterales bacterium]
MPRPQGAQAPPQGAPLAGRRPSAPSSPQAALRAALRETRGGLEAAIRARIEGDDAPIEATDPEYGAGLRAAIPLAIDYCLDGIERGEASPPPLPTGLLFQARVAARSKVPLGVVMRRYFAGYVLLGDFMAREAEGWASIEPPT